MQRVTFAHVSTSSAPSLAVPIVKRAPVLVVTACLPFHQNTRATTPSSNGGVEANASLGLASQDARTPQSDHTRARIADTRFQAPTARRVGVSRNGHTDRRAAVGVGNLILRWVLSHSTHRFLTVTYSHAGDISLSDTASRGLLRAQHQRTQTTRRY